MDAFATPPKLLTKCCRGKAPLVFALLRVCLFGSWVGVLYWQSSAYSSSSQDWGAYVTSWSLVWQTIYLFFAAMTTVLAVAKMQPCSWCVTTPWYAHVTWLMHMTAVVIPVLAALIYGLFIHHPCEILDGAPPAAQDDCTPDAVAYGLPELHALGATAAILDFSIHQHWYPPWDISIPICFGSIYLSFTYLHYKQTETVLYNTLDWSDSGAAAIFGLMILVVVIPAVYSVFAWLDLLFKQRKLFKVVRTALACLVDWASCCWCKAVCGPKPKPKRDLEAQPMDAACQTEGGTGLLAALAPDNPPDMASFKRTSFRRVLSHDDSFTSAPAAMSRRLSTCESLRPAEGTPYTSPRFVAS
eukprot:scaffold23233_cov111-Isochrysis_galbana.AAC.4